MDEYRKGADESLMPRSVPLALAVFYCIFNHQRAIGIAPAVKKGEPYFLFQNADHWLALAK
jgi:hypothetical protein